MCDTGDSTAWAANLELYNLVSTILAFCKYLILFIYCWPQLQRRRTFTARDNFCLCFLVVDIVVVAVVMFLLIKMYWEIIILIILVIAVLCSCDSSHDLSFFLYTRICLSVRLLARLFQF